jgi:tetratricopeptide (TPR) repeat protein
MRRCSSSPDAAWRRKDKIGRATPEKFLKSSAATWPGSGFFSSSAAATARQAEIEREVHGVLRPARALLDTGWQANDLGKLTEAKAAADRAVDIAQSGKATAAVQEQASAFQAEAEARLERARRNHTLLETLLDVSVPPNRNNYRPGSIEQFAEDQRSDQQYADAFRRWGLDVDGTEEAEVVARLWQEPEAVRQEVLAGLDSWMLQRRRQNRPEAQWRRLYWIADRLDRGDRRQLRALLVGQTPPRPESVAGLVGARSPWSALWELARGSKWRRLQPLNHEVGAETPVLTVALLAQANRDVGDVTAAERVLRRALAARPDQVVLLDALGRLLQQQWPLRLAEAIECFRAARARRPGLGFTLGRVLLLAGRAEEAEDVFREMVRRQPGNPGAHVDLGIALFVRNKWREAEAANRRAIALEPDHSGTYNNLGGILRQQKRLGEAEVAFRKAIALAPGLVEAHLNLGLALQRQAQFKDALAALQKGYELLHVRDPRRAQARQLVMQCRRQLRLDVRYGAARCAALAGCGQGKDAARMDGEERARWRRQARDWLGADLAWWGKAVDKVSAQ